MAGKSKTTSLGPRPAHDQQRLLDIFAAALHGTLSSPHFPGLLRDIKQALFRRDFAAAFGSSACLEAYAARWSPTRALCYAAVLRGISGHLHPVLVPRREPSPGSAAQHAPLADDAGLTSNRLAMLSIGGCAAEQVALASLLRDTASRGTLTLVDSAPWSHVTSLLQNQLTTPPRLSKYASAAARASSQPLLLESQLSLTFHQGDALSLTEDQLTTMAGTDPLVVTLLFTLNELYTDGGIGKTTRLLRSLGGAMPHASLLLVVDSPGSYSQAAVGKDKKRYPMQWLLSHTLLETEAHAYEWERLESQDSVWFRLPEGLSYPIQLENMRYQMHLYRIHKPPRPKDA